MLVQLTPSGEQAVWDWLRAVAKDADALVRHEWMAYAQKQVNLCDPSFDGLYRICLRGSAAANGHLQALIMQAGWYRVMPKPTKVAASPQFSF